MNNQKLVKSELLRRQCWHTHKANIICNAVNSSIIFMDDNFFRLNLKLANIYLVVVPISHVNSEVIAHFIVVNDFTAECV